MTFEEAHAEFVDFTVKSIGRPPSSFEQVVYRDAWNAARRETALEIADEEESRCRCTVVKCDHCKRADEIRRRYGGKPS